jgi:ribonucleoside-triphosphate reductase
MTIQEIQKEIDELRNEMNDAKGTECEVYTRIVGYNRSVRHWNEGKKEEYKTRKVFRLRKQKCDECEYNPDECNDECSAISKTETVDNQLAKDEQNYNHDEELSTDHIPGVQCESGICDLVGSPIQRTEKLMEVEHENSSHKKELSEIKC